MTSRYDQPDERPYESEGLSITVDVECCLCLWCGALFAEAESDSLPYCSPLCATQAAVDSEEN